MSCHSSNPRRAPMTLRNSNVLANGLSLKSATLRKGATFHSPSSPSQASSLRRSQSSLDDVVDDYCRRAASALDTIDKTLAGAAPFSPSSSSVKDTSPLPRGIFDVTLGDMMVTSSAKVEECRRALRSRHYREPSDSGIGSSITTLTQKRTVPSPKRSSAKGADAVTCSSASSTSTVVITRSAAAAAATVGKQAGLSQKGFARVNNHVLKPLLAKPSFKDFHSIVRNVPRKIRKKEIVCLRDVEKTLLLSAPNKAKTANRYVEFCLTSIALIQTTVDRLSERDQVRAGDRPFTNGYFIDLCDQVKHYASLLAATDKMSATEPSTTFNITDEVRMWGGIAVNGREAELIRITKEGKAFSLRDGREIMDYTNDRKEGVPMFKRSLSQTLEDEEIRRSMARRKKNPTPEELAPKVCKHPGCGKEFPRPCDLTKHEKTHSRPWKCPEPTCKYHEQGWPTEKEMDRHYNDKHAPNPHFYHCRFEPCPYKSKRESNCKQHMEKAHGWKYDRTKHNGKKSLTDNLATSTNPTPTVPSLPTPNSDQAFEASPQALALGNSVPITMADPIAIPNYRSDVDFMNQFSESANVTLDMDLDIELSPVADSGTPHTDPSSENLFNLGADMTTSAPDDIYAATLQMPPTPTDAGLKDFQPMNQALFPNPPMTTTPMQHPLRQQLIQQTPGPEGPISPMRQVNPMLFTPSSMKEVNHAFMDEGLDCGDDFLLFPPSKSAALGFSPNTANLFPDIASTSAGFDQQMTVAADLTSPSPSQDLTAANLQTFNQINAMDWSMDLSSFNP